MSLPSSCHRCGAVATLGAAALFLGAAAAFAAIAADATDACLLISPQQLGAALGVPMGAGAHTTPQYMKTCTWLPSGKATAALKFVTLDVKSANRFEEGKRMLQQPDAHVTVTPLGGVGDDAFYAAFGPTITSLNVKKGGTAFKLTVYGTMAAQSMAAEKALASQVVAQL